MKFKDYSDKLHNTLIKEVKEDSSICYYKKRRVYPILNEDGSINYFNLLTGGSYLKLIGTLIVIGIIIGCIVEYHSNVQYCLELINEYNLKDSILNQTFYLGGQP